MTDEEAVKKELLKKFPKAQITEIEFLEFDTRKPDTAAAYFFLFCILLEGP